MRTASLSSAGFTGASTSGSFRSMERPIENARRRTVQITRQTGQVQTPSIGATDREIVYLSDSGGHGNLWVDQHRDRFEPGRSPSSRIPRSERWRPRLVAGRPTHRVLFDPRGGVGVETRSSIPNGGNLRHLAPNAGWATCHSTADGCITTSSRSRRAHQCWVPLKKIRPEGGRPSRFATTERRAQPFRLTVQPSTSSSSVLR